MCSSSGGQLYEYIWYNHSVLVAVRLLAQSDYTRSCIKPYPANVENMVSS